jgi:glycosyltransferase involved in cell wall biosynthesis
VVIEETAQGFPADEALAPSNPSILAREAARWRLFWRAICWADVVHFSFGQSCLVPHAFPDLRTMNSVNPLVMLWRLYCRGVWLKDLPFLARMGKTLAVTWQGDDARQHDRSLELFDISIAKTLGDAYYLRGSDGWKRRKITAFARYAPLHYALNPDLLHVLPSQARFLPYASLDPRGVSAAPPALDDTGAVIFVHAPSHRGAKGTEHVLAAAQTLRAEGLLFELWLIEGLPRDQAMARYAGADVVIDQLLAGWYGGLAVEAMALGKPVIAYLREDDLGALDLSMRSELPVTSATSTSIAEVMRRFVTMPRAELRALGIQSRAFVERWHDPRTIAERTLVDYQRAEPECMR